MRTTEAVGRITSFLLASALLVVAASAAAMEKGHEGMPGMKDHGAMPGMSGHGAAEGHGGMTKMGDKLFGGKIGPWKAEARLVDMKAQMEKLKLSEKQKAMTKSSHHLMISLEDPASKKPLAEGKGTVVVSGPDKKSEKYDLAGMGDHLGADVTLPKPGRYTFRVEIESGGKKGSAKFAHTVK